MNGKLIFFAGLIIAIIVVLMFFLFGGYGIWSVITWSVIGIVFIGIIALTFYAVYHIFFEEKRVDINALNHEKLVQSAKLSKPPYLNSLYIKGDKTHQSAWIGKILGYCRIENFKGEQEDVFVVKRSLWLFRFLEENRVVRIRPQDHSELIGDIYLNALSLIKIGEYYYINQDYLDLKQIDESIKSEAMRTMMHMTFSDMKTMVDIAAGLDAIHNKQIENKKLLQQPRQNESEEK